MTLDGGTKQKRNKPCENCRAHRRKCFIAQGMQCQRCFRMELPCVFKFTVKPDISRKFVPVSKRNRMFDQVHLIEEEVVAMEEQLRSLAVTIQLNNSSNNKSSPDYADSQQQHNSKRRQKRAKDDNSSGCGDDSRAGGEDWQLTLSQSSSGLQFQTSIKTAKDISAFLKGSMRYFSLASPSRPPTYYVDRHNDRITITYKLLQVERVLKDMFAKRIEHGVRSGEEKHTLAHVFPSRSFIKLHFLDAYFHCFGLTYPIFVLPHQLLYLRNRPNSMLTTAIAAFIGFSQCQHINIVGMSVLRRQLIAESFRQEARELLEEALFEQEPNLETMGTLKFLGQAALILLRNNEARVFLGMAWRMSILLRDKYLDILRNEKYADEGLLVEAESWRRMFYKIRYLELNLRIIQDGRQNVSEAVLCDDIGLPLILPTEATDPHTVHSLLLFQHIIRLNECQLFMQMDRIGHQLMSGATDFISCIDVERLESQMITFWRSLPTEFKLSDGPMEYLQQERVRQCYDYHILYLNKFYYAWWLAFETRIMQDPERTNLTGASLNRIDGDRALVIVSICSDALANIFEALHRILPCVIESHVVLVAADACKMLTSSQNASIRARAESNLRSCLGVLSNLIGIVSPKGMGHDIRDPNSGMLTPSSDDGLLLPEDDYCDLSPGASTPNDAVAYFGELKRALGDYFADHVTSSSI